MLYFHCYAHGNEIVRMPSRYGLPNCLMCLLIDFSTEMQNTAFKRTVIQKYTNHQVAKNQVSFRKALPRICNRASSRYIQSGSKQARSRFER